MKNIDKVIAGINEDFGDNTIFSISDPAKVSIPKIVTGLTSIDEVTGGGIPCGRITEIFGPESCGKTTLCLKLAAMAQQDGLVAYIDMEHSLDLVWAEKIGVKTKDLLLSQPECAEQALDIVVRLIDSGRIKLIVVDSVAALVPRSELEGDIGDASIGVQARLMGQLMRKITASLHKSNTALVFINQIRQKVGVLYGNPETTPGGNALKFYSSLRLRVSRDEIIKEKKESIAVCIKTKVVKNKIAAPFQEGIFQIDFDGKVE